MEMEELTLSRFECFTHNQRNSYAVGPGDLPSFIAFLRRDQRFEVAPGLRESVEPTAEKSIYVSISII